MAHTTLWLGVIAFNLIRHLLQRAAARDGQPVWDLSFKGVLDHVVASHESFRAHAGRPRKRAAALNHLLEICAAKRIDIRPFRKVPRATKRRPKSYQLLTEPKANFRKITTAAATGNVLDPVPFGSMCKS